MSGRCTVPKEMVFYFAIYRTQSLSEPHRVFCGLYTVLVGKPEGKNSLVNPRVDGRILGWLFRKWEVGLWTGLSWLNIGTGSGKRQLGRTRRRWDDNIRMALQELGGEVKDWIQLAQCWDR